MKDELTTRVYLCGGVYLFCFLVPTEYALYFKHANQAVQNRKKKTEGREEQGFVLWTLRAQLHIRVFDCNKRLRGKVTSNIPSKKGDLPHFHPGIHGQR